MDNDYKTNFVEPQQNVAVADVEQTPGDELTAKALEEIRSTERLSGFGRFAMKLQNFFQSFGRQFIARRALDIRYGNALLRLDKFGFVIVVHRRSFLTQGDTSQAYRPLPD